MRVTLYLDATVWHANNGDWFAWSSPGPKLDGVKRYRIDIDIPDPREPDEIVRPKAEEIAK